MSQASIVIVACALASSIGGCAAIQGPHQSVRPSAQEELADVRLFDNVSALAVPEDAIVRVVGPSMTCTGTVIDDDMILTAHHCLVQRGEHGEYTKQLIDPNSVRIEIGGDQLAWGEVGAKHIVAPPCGEGGGAGDIAVLVLKRKVIGLSTMVPRLDVAPRMGDVATPFGFGKCQNGPFANSASAEAVRRKERMGGSIKQLSTETMRLDAVICAGDSGGPVFATENGHPTRQIIGVVSLAALDHDESTRAPSVMARVDAYRSVFMHARMVADGMAPNELPPLECSADGASSGRVTPKTPKK